MIIGIAGRKRVGKNFVSDVIAGFLRRDQNVKLVAFADPIKKYCHEVLGIEKKYLWGDGDKNTATKYFWDVLPLDLRALKYPSERSDNANDGINCFKSGPMTIRQVMQVVGTEIGRNIWGKDIWVNAMKREIDKKEAGSYIITDVRMTNEAEAIRNWGGIVIKVNGVDRGGGGFIAYHETETSIDSIVPDAIIDNGLGTTREDVEAQARKILRWE